MPEKDEAAAGSEPERLAQRVRDELAAAGLPLAVPGLAPELAVGAEVRVDRWGEYFHSEAPQVVVGWSVSPQLRMSAGSALQRGQIDHPAIRQQGEAMIAMADAVVAILGAAGFTAVHRNNDLSPFDIRVVSGPDTRALPSWAPVNEKENDHS